MLQINPLAPPRPPRSRPVADRFVPAGERLGAPFVSAEDFDGTGILAGVDPCESRYWWLPELGGPADVADRERHAATVVRTTAAG